jgi:hypothetical protein
MLNVNSWGYDGPRHSSSGHSCNQQCQCPLTVPKPGQCLSSVRACSSGARADTRFRPFVERQATLYGRPIFVVPQPANAYCQVSLSRNDAGSRERARGNRYDSLSTLGMEAQFFSGRTVTWREHAGPNLKESGSEFWKTVSCKGRDSQMLLWCQQHSSRERERVCVCAAHRPPKNGGLQRIFAS